MCCAVLCCVLLCASANLIVSEQYMRVPLACLAQTCHSDLLCRGGKGRLAGVAADLPARAILLCHNADQRADQNGHWHSLPQESNPGTHSLTRSLTHSLTHSLARSLAHFSSCGIVLRCFSHHMYNTCICWCLIEHMHASATLLCNTVVNQHP